MYKDVIWFKIVVSAACQILRVVVLDDILT